jgi:predicted glycosyltransferase/glycosyltransferase involved in cell wall biosynthesis
MDESRIIFYGKQAKKSYAECSSSFRYDRCIFQQGGAHPAMRVIVDINHPADVHFFKNFIRGMEERGHTVLITASRKEISYRLLDNYGFLYEKLGSYGKSLAEKMINIPLLDIRMFMVAKKFNPDIFVGFGSIRAAHVSKLLNKPCINFEDTDHAKWEHRLYVPFADVVISPQCFGKDFGKKHIKIDTYKELFYLHPDYFRPDISVLADAGIGQDEKFSVVRFVAWDAQHDLGQKGLQNREEIVDQLEKYGKVFITSEVALPDHLKKYQITVPLEKLHDLLYFATLCFGEGSTTAAEAAMMGTPSVYVSSLAGSLGYVSDLEQKYGLLYNFKDQEPALAKAVELLKNPQVKEEWKRKRDAFLKDKLNATRFLLWFVETYPQSFVTMKKKPAEPPCSPGTQTLTDTMEKPNLLIITHMYATFIKDQINQMAPRFSNIYVLVRTNPLAEISRIIPVPYLVPFSVAQKIDLSNKPENVHVIQTPVIYFPTEKGYEKLGRNHLRSVERELKKNKIEFDIIHAHFTWSAGYAGSKLKETYGVPFVITAHGMDIYDLPFKNAFYTSHITRILNSADHIITVSRNNLESIERLGVKKPVSVILNGFNDHRFYPRDMRECRRQLGLPQDKKILINVAKLYDAVKGHEILIRAMQDVIKTRGDVVCYIVGDGELRASMEKLIAELHLEQHVKIVGAKPHHEIPFWINAGDVFVLPSLNEGNPTVMFECLGCAKPFIGTRVGGIPETITDETYGLLSEPGNVQELAKNILSSLSRDWDESKISAYAKQFTWENISKEILAVYSKVYKKDL